MNENTPHILPAPPHVRLGWKLPIRIPATIAQERMDRRIEQWADMADEITTLGGADPEKGIVAPAFVLKGSQSLGKTVSILRTIRRIRRKHPQARGLYLTQTIELGDEIGKKLEASGMSDVFVYRGRAQANPGTGEQMCAKADIAATVAALGFSVANTLCRKKLDNGEVKECPFAATCAYLAQSEKAKLPGLIIAAQTYLSIPVEVFKDVDYVIIDESFWQSMTATRRVDLGRFLTHRGIGKGFKGDRQKIEEANYEIGNAVEDMRAIVAICDKAGRQPTIADFRARGFSPEYCRYLVELERSRVSNEIGIEPDQHTEAQAAILKDADAQEALGYIRVWKSVGTELATSRNGQFNSFQIVYGDRHPKTGELQNIILCHYRRKTRFPNVPTIIIDANADAHIIRKFYPQASFFRIEAEWSQHVQLDQSYDWEGSMQALKDESNRDKVWNMGAFMTKRHARLIAEGNAAGEDRRPLIMSTKSTIDAFREDGGTEQAGFRSEHAGNTRGKDGYKASVAGGVIGRIQPGTGALEALARCLFADSEEELGFVAPDTEGRNPLPRCKWELVAKNGERQPVEISFHPHWFVHRVLLQIREAEVMQCLTRFRPIWRGPEVPCEMFAITNVPLSIIPDRLWKRGQMLPDRFDMAWMAGFVPEIAQDMADSYPEAFASKGAVRTAASRREERAFAVLDGSHGEAMGGRYNRLYSSNKDNVTGVRVSYERSSKDGRGGSAWVEFVDGETREDIIAKVRTFLPDAHDFSFVMPKSADRAPIEAANDNIPTFIRRVSRAAILMGQLIGPELPWWKLVPNTNGRIMERRAA